MKKENFLIGALIAGLALGILYLASQISGGRTGTLGGESNVVFTDDQVASASFSVTTTSVQVLARNGSALYRRCQNMTGAPAYLSMSDGASKSWGIGLKSSESFDFFLNKNLYIGPVHAITVAGTAKISCIEASYR